MYLRTDQLNNRGGNSLFNPAVYFSIYIALAERFLGFQQPGSVYGFSDAGDSHRKLPWTFEKEGTKLEWR